MKKFAITYKAEYTRDTIITSIIRKCGGCYDKATTVPCVWKLLHSVAYSSVLLIPERFLEDCKSYSIEDICSYQVGMINSVGLHDLIQSIAESDSPDETITQLLSNLIVDPLLPELVQLLRLPLFEIYGALCASYSLLISDSMLFNQVRGIMSMSRVNKYQRLYGLFV